MQSISKALIGSAAIGAMALASASPAMARDRNDNGIDGGDILAGALVLGGIAAVAAIASNGRDRDDYRRGNRYDGYNGYDNYDRRDYRGGGYQQDAVDTCVRAAENAASRYRYGARVTQIRDINRERNGFEVKGRIAVRDGGRDYRRANWDEGSFKCEIRGNRIRDLDFSGIRGL